MTRRGRKKNRTADRDLIEAKRRTSASALRAQREYRISVKRLADSQRVALSLSVQNAFLEQMVSNTNHNRPRRG